MTTEQARMKKPLAKYAGEALARITSAEIGYAAAYLFAYVLLDWVSYVQPYRGFGITPWNPYTGLSVAFVLLAGIRTLPLLFIAPILSEYVVRGPSIPWPYLPLAAGAIAVVYATTGLLLRSKHYRFDPKLGRLRDVATLLAAAALSAAIVATCYVSIHWLADLIASDELDTAIVRYWIGDVIGIAVITPSLLVLNKLRRPRRAPRFFWVQPLTVMVALWIVFGHTWASRFQLFYVLFLPIVWIGITSGIEGACLALLTTQVGLMLALQTVVAGPVDVTAFQAVMIVLTVTGLLVGAIVSERWRTDDQLRLLQGAQARLDRLGSMGAFGAALAHEINQPLSAAATYARLATDALGEDGRAIDMARLRDLVGKGAAQVQRAGDVMRRLRDLLQLGRVALEPIEPQRLVREALALMEPELERAAIQLSLSIEPGLPPVAADRLQIEQVIINLVRNAIEAVEDAGTPNRQIRVTTARASPGLVCIEVRDSGPGFAPEQIAQPAVPMSTTKAGGLGIGLALCETIIRAHGGQLSIENIPQGAMVRFTLKEVEAREK